MRAKKVELPLNLINGLWTMLVRTRHIMYKARQLELHQYNIPIQSSGTLRTILRLGDKATPSTISRQLFLEPHSLSEQLKRMENAGLIRRVQDSTKRRNGIRVELTAKGLEACNISSKRESISAIISTLTQEEQLELWHILAKLRSAAIKHIGMKEMDLYPPSNPEEYHEVVTITQKAKLDRMA